MLRGLFLVCAFVYLVCPQSLEDSTPTSTTRRTSTWTLTVDDSSVHDAYFPTYSYSLSTSTSTSISTLPRPGITPTPTPANGACSGGCGLQRSPAGILAGWKSSTRAYTTTVTAVTEIEIVNNATNTTRVRCTRQPCRWLRRLRVLTGSCRLQQLQTSKLWEH